MNHPVFFDNVEGECDTLLHCCACLADVDHIDPDGSGCEWCDFYAEIVVAVNRMGKHVLVDLGIRDIHPQGYPHTEHMTTWMLTVPKPKRPRLITRLINRFRRNK